MFLFLITIMMNFCGKSKSAQSINEEINCVRNGANIRNKTEKLSLIYF